jgi:hypothetical protein
VRLRLRLRFQHLQATQLTFRCWLFVQQLDVVSFAFVGRKRCNLLGPHWKLLMVPSGIEHVQHQK